MPPASIPQPQNEPAAEAAAGPPSLPAPVPKRQLYFINEEVEDLLRRYIWTGCTKVALRDAIMSHATELIRQIIRKQNLHTIYPGGDDSSFSDLVQTAWVQIERTLYKFRARPHCRRCFNPDRPNDSALYTPDDMEYGIKTYRDLAQMGVKSCPKCGTKLQEFPVVEAEQDRFGGSTTVLFRGNSKVFNMWSQIARTVILAHIKKECRDKKNSSVYRDHVTSKLKHKSPEDNIISIDGLSPPGYGGGMVDSDDLQRTMEESLAKPLPPQAMRKALSGSNKRGSKKPVPKLEVEMSDSLRRFLTEAREMCKYSDEYLLILDALEHMLQVDDEPASGIIGKLVEHSGLSRVVVTQFIRHIRLRSFEFTDSPISRADESRRFDKPNTYPAENDDE